MKITPDSVIDKALLFGRLRTSLPLEYDVIIPAALDLTAGCRV
jgi:hypothetical protein